MEDIINQGLRLGLTGSVAMVTDGIVQAAMTERTIVVTGFIISTSSVTDVLVSLGFNNGVSTVIFTEGYVKSGGPIIYTYTIGDERYSSPGDSLVITTSGAGPTVYTVNGRLIGEKVALGYLEQAGATAHSSPWFPDPGGKDRGGFPA